MTYRSYEARIQRIAAVTKGIRKFAKLIAAVLLLTVVAAVGYLFARGMVVGGVTCAPVLDYGDTLRPSSTVLMGKAVYEYASMDSEEWTTTAPVMPGQYRVRAVTRRSFGLTGHSKATTFTIQPRRVTVTVTESQIPYGGTPTVSADLPDGDQIKVTGLVYHNLSFNPTLVHIPENGVQILNKDGEDVTGAYEVYTKDKVVDIIPRPLTIVVPSVSKPYDGTPLTSSDWSIATGSLMEGDVLEVTFGASQTVVSEEPVRNVPVSIVVKNAQGVDVTTHYDIQGEYGTLTITPAIIQIATNSPSPLVYGIPPDIGEGTMPLVVGEITLPAGHTSEATFPALADAGVQDNICTLRVFNAAGEEVAPENFEIQGSWGTLTVLPRPLVLVTPNGSKVYDGTPLVKSNAQLKPMQTYGTLPGHIIVAVEESVPQPTNVGEVENRFDVRILDNNGNDVTANYALTFEYGTLNVTKRELVITTGSKTKEYDGAPLTCTDVARAEGLLDGQTISVLESTEITWVSAPVANEFHSVQILTAEGVDVTRNYEIVYNTNNPGRLQVSPRPLKVVTPTYEFEYDGTAHSWTQGFIYDERTPLPLGHAVEEAPQTATTITHVGRVENRMEIRVLDAGGGEVTSCFLIEYVYGELTVTPRPITLIPASDEKVYDGIPLECRGFTVGGRGLVEGQEIRLPENFDYVSIVNATFADGVPNIFPETGYRIIDGVEDVTSDYAITVDNEHGGRLVITPRPITITPDDAEKIYDDTPLTSDAYTITENTLVFGHQPEIVMNGSITNVGTTTNEIIRHRILDASGDDMTANYRITTQVGQLEVLKRPITVRTDDMEWVYQDIDLSHAEFDVTSRLDLVETHSLLVLDSTRIHDVGTAENQFTDYCILNSMGENVTPNYEVSMENGTLTVLHRPLVITTDSYTQRYSGQSVSHPYAASTEGLLEGIHQLMVDKSTTQILAGTYTNEFYEVRILRTDGSEVDVTENYVISYDEENAGKIVIQRLPVVVQTASATFMYDGLAHSAPYDMAGSLPAGHKLDPTGAATITDVGEIPNAMEIRILNEFDEDVTSCFNILPQSSFGTLRVVPRNVILISGTAEKVYDGLPLVSRDFELEPGKDLEGNQLKFTLVGGHEIFLPEDYTYSTITNVGSIDNVFPTEGYKVMMGERDVSANYNIIVSERQGTLTVTRRPITVAPARAQKAYDGFPLTGNLPEIRVGSLVEGHIVSLITEPECECIEIGEYINRIVPGGCTITDGEGTDVTDNYEITYEEGKLVIVYRIIDIQTESAIWQYDGGLHTLPDYVILSEQGFMNGHTFEVMESTGIRDAGTLNNTISVWRVLDASGEDVSSYYIINFIEGTLQVDPKPLHITTGSASKEFDGFDSPLTCPEWDSMEGLMTELGHRFEVNASTEIAAPGEVDNEFTDVTIYDADDMDVTANYDIQYTKGTLTVIGVKIALEVTPYEISVTYDGLYHGPTGNEYWISNGSLPEGYTITDVQFVGNYADAGEYTSRVTSLRVLDERGVDVTFNCDITYKDAPLIIKPCELVLQTGSLTVKFDGDEHSNTADPELLAGALAQGHTIEYTLSTSIKNHGSVHNLLDRLVIRDANGEIFMDFTSGDPESFQTEILNGKEYAFEEFRDYNHPGYVIKVYYGVLTVTWR